MQSVQPDALSHQRRIDNHFDASAVHWLDLYQEPTLDGLIHQQRHALALRWIEGLRLPAGSAVIDVGCGAGLLAVDLARRGFRVDAIDTSEAMVELARGSAARAAVGEQVAVQVGDVHQLPFDSRSHQLIVALGVLPFLHSPATALSEMRRVLSPGGFALMSSDNLYRLNHLLDPRYAPWLSPLKKPARAAARRLGHDWVVPRRYRWRTLRRLLAEAGLQPIRDATVGFGPFSLLGWRPIPNRAAIRLHNRLQGLADAGAPILQSTGAQHLVLARVSG